MRNRDYDIGSETWPGLSKLIEECGEVTQVSGKIIGCGGDSIHYDGSDLRRKLEEELADLTAAVSFVTRRCQLDESRILDRAREKAVTFERWHAEESSARKK